MSLDYPNREDWLRVRATPRRPNLRWFHVSKGFVIMDGKLVWLKKGVTYRKPKP